MESTGLLSCITSILTFILLTVPGYIARKKNYLTDTHLDGFSFILIHFLWPSMIIDAMSSVSVDTRLVHLCIYTVALALCMYMASLLIAYLYIKAKNPAPSAKGLIMFSICFNNTGFIGLPLIKEMLGNEALLLGSMVELICDILIFSIGIMLFQSTSSRNKSIQLRNFISPCFISLLIGLIMFFFHIHLPIIIMKPIQYMSGATTVIAMLLTGAQLGELSFKELFSDKRVYPLCFLRLILIPALLFVTLLCLQQFLPVAEWFSGSFSSANTILIIMAATPIAACTCVFARQYKGDYLFATKSVMISTLLSAFSIPAWLMMTSFLH